MSLIYVASPYSHPDLAVQEQRYLEVEAFCALMLTNGSLPLGTVLFSPIVYCHNMAVRHRLPTDAAWWLAINNTMMKHADEFWVLRLSGWEESRGVTQERAQWLEQKKVIQYYDLNGTTRPWETGAIMSTG